MAAENQTILIRIKNFFRNAAELRYSSDECSLWLLKQFTKEFDYKVLPVRIGAFTSCEKDAEIFESELNALRTEGRESVDVCGNTARELLICSAEAGTEPMTESAQAESR